MGRLFGTFGVRGIANEDINPSFACKLGLSFASYLKEGAVVAVGMDTRTTSEMLKSAAVSGLLAGGVEVIDIGTVPTPTVQFACRHFKADGGLMVTASHNPAEYNGIKLLGPEGVGLQRENDARVEDIYFSEKFRRAPWDRIKPARKENILPVYTRELMKNIDSGIIRKKSPKVVVDCGSGAGCFLAPQVLRELGCRVVSLNAQPDGFFPGRNPEPLPENLGGLMEAVMATHADIGVALDGDADRCVTVDEKGQVVWGDKTFALVAADMLKAKKGLVVSSVATSHLVKETAERNGGSYEATRVGELVIAKVLLDRKGLLGGEENGGLIFPDFTLGMEGTLTAAKIIEVLCKSGIKFSELVDSLPKFYQTKTKVRGPMEKVGQVLSRIKLEGKIDRTDGIKAVFDDGSWVIIRPSGTEPMMRVFTEARTLERAEELKSKYAKMVESLLDS